MADLAMAQDAIPPPYYERDGISIYHGDCRAILPKLKPDDVAMVLTDPPYGVNERCNRASRGRGPIAGARDFPDIEGDREPFEPGWLLVYPKVVIWGANHYADRLPPSAAWLVWDKLDGLASKRAVGFCDQADVEMAWTNLRGPARVFRHRWMGMLKASERQSRRVHPTQKPVALMRWIVENWTRPGDLVVDPYMGSGPVAQACHELGRRYIGVELVEDYCRAAVDRIGQTSLFA